jgi:hypothetical protein
MFHSISERYPDKLLDCSSFTDGGLGYEQEKGFIHKPFSPFQQQLNEPSCAGSRMSFLTRLRMMGFAVSDHD